ncbi:SipW-dependent-type signal peptide-containing protein [Candidatus Saccharibacteria bacterium]|nr:SipW-dependent-type signal peptide-containing protein [Candidatus Saccharibacteria bacterium]
MYHKVRITVVSLVVMAICVLSSVGTLSYFTDTDAATNEFMVGYASTVLKIYDDVSDASNKHEIVASDYTAVDNYVLKYASSITEEQLDSLPFYLQASNDGNIPVYQRFRVVIPIALANVVSLDLPNTYNGCNVKTAENNTCSNDDYTITYNPSVSVEDTPTYAEYYIVSNDKIIVNGKTKEWPINGIKFGAVSGLGELLMCENNSSNCAVGIKAYSDAIQTAGFQTATAAFAGVGETY